MKKRKKLKFYSIKFLAKYLGFGEDFLLWVTKNHPNLYRFRPKININGKLRDIYIVDKSLKKILVAIDRKILDRVALPSTFHGGIKGKSTRTSAEKHRGAKEILIIDIKDFFPSITPKMVCRAFLSLGMSHKCAEILTTVVTVTRPQTHLPQGFTTSPKIAALVLLKLDKKLHELSIKYGWHHTFWIDDIVISGNMPVGKFKNLIIKLVRQSGFEINPKKINILKKNERRSVHGIVINSSPNIPKENRLRIKNILYILKKFGPKKYLTEKGITANSQNINKLKKRLEGKISYIFGINQKFGRYCLKELEEIKWPH